MNWVCDSCGYENEYNDESQPTECLCCGEPASEHLLNQARRALDKYHKEQERQRRLEQLRLEAIRRQEKIEHSIKTFIKGVRTLATACIVFMVLSVALAGFNFYKGNISFKHISGNVKSITVVDNMVVPVNVISDNLSKTASGVSDNITQNVSYMVQIKNYTVTENLNELLDENKERMTATASNLKGIGDDLAGDYEQNKGNVAVPQSNVSGGYKNLTANSKLFWKQATQNINQLIDSISKKFGRAK